MITAQLIGGKKLVAKLAAASAGVVRGGDAAAEMAAKYVAEYARDFVARDTGKTEMSIRVEGASFGYKVIADRLGDASAVPVFLEFGTARMDARPFMRPAIDLVVGTELVGAQIRTTGGLLVRA